MDPSARIAYVLGSFPSPSETFILTEMSLLRERGIEPLVVALERGPDVGDDRVAALEAAARYRPARWVCVLQSLFYGIGGDARARLHGAAAARFAEQLASLTPTHVHAHFMGAPTLVGHAMARMMGLSFTFSCHASDVFTAGDPTPEEHAAVYDAHAIIACSEYLRKHLIERRGYPREKVITIHHGIDLSRVPERAAPTDSTEPVLVAVGRLVPKKGFDVLLRAAAPMLKQDRIALRIVGEGPEGTRLRALAVDLGVLDRVEFLGRLTWEDTLRTIAESSALIAPSVMAEDGDMDGIPNVLLEAGALGVPVIASRLSGIPELVEDGKTGLLTASGDEGALGKALRRVADSADLRAQLGGASRERIRRKWSAADSVGQIAGLFREAAAHTTVPVEGIEGARA